MAEKRNGSRKVSEAERLGLELQKTNGRITEHTQWLRALSNDLRRLGEKLYGITEGRVTLADVNLPDGRYRTPDQAPVESSEFRDAAERMAQVKRRFVKMENDLAAADDLRLQLEKRNARAMKRRKAS